MGRHALNDTMLYWLAMIDIPLSSPVAAPIYTTQLPDSYILDRRTDWPEAIHIVHAIIHAKQPDIQCRHHLQPLP